MKNDNYIRGNNEDEIWQQISGQFLENSETLKYTAVIDHANHRIILDIDIDPGGGFESGFETTTFSASIHTGKGFHFAMHEEHLTDEIGKFFGMEDVITGYEDFDKKLIIKTNDPDKIKAVFEDRSVRNVLLALHDFTFTLGNRQDEDQNKQILELMIENGITNINMLRKIYCAFYTVLETIERIH